MFLATGPLMEFAQFLQIISWIMLPVLLPVVLLTVFIHYRRKRKKNTAKENPAEEFLLASPDATGPMKRDAYLLFDHSGLIRQYRNKLSYHHARYTALRYDFEKLELKYSAALITGDTRSTQLKISTMQNTTEQLQLTLNKMTEEYTAEKEQLLSRLQQLDRSYKSLESENESLLEQIQLQTATGDEKVIIVNRWKEENNELNNQVREQAWLKDVIEEKKAQIEFLQNQVDQRIRQYHQAEQHHHQLKNELEQMKQNHQQDSDELDRLRNESLRHQEMITQFQNVLNENESQLSEKQQLLISRLDHITYLENIIQEIKQQNELLNAAVADHHDRTGNLQQQLEEERSGTLLMGQKLQANKQLLQRLYKEFTACMEDDGQPSPVVTLRPSYISKINTEEEWDETAVQ